MFNPIATTWLRVLDRPCFRIHGKARREGDWRIIDVFATRRRNDDSSWPPFLWRGTCVTWTMSAIAVGWDFAEEVLREQVNEPASRDRPVEVAGGRLHDLQRRLAAGGAPWASASEVLAHECGHTWQASRLSWAYLPLGAMFTWYREGRHWWNGFENQASEEGLFGGIVNGSVCEALMERLRGT
jgi:hypothetical protein